MKRLIDYAPFAPFVSYSIFLLIFLLFNNGNLIIKLFALASGIIAIIYLFLFLDEYIKAKKINKDGKFVLGTLDKASVKKKYYTRGAYILKGSISYYNEQEKLTMHFSGYDIINSRIMRYSRVMKIVEEEEISVLVGYLPYDSTICTIWLRDALDKYL